MRILFRKKGFALAILLAFAFVFVGCAGCPRTNDTTGVTTKTKMNCVNNVVDGAEAMVCSPPPAVMTVVTAAIAIFSTMTRGNAAFDMAVCQSIQTVGCTDLTALDQLITDINSINAAGAYAKMGAMVLDPSPLVDWSHNAKYLCVSRTAGRTTEKGAAQAQAVR